jgi:hypothetical protein
MRAGTRFFTAPNPATAVLEIWINSQVREPAAHRFIKLDVPDEIGRMQTANV